MVADEGGAPCVAAEKLSLAICKPIIRRCAAEKSWIYGFAGNTLSATHPDNSLIYVAKITRKIKFDDYANEFSDRADSIYKRESKTYRLRNGALYHLQDNHLEHDLGKPPGYENAWVLMSDEFMYFGPDGPKPAEVTTSLAIHINQIGRGHRVGISDEVLGGLEQLRNLAFSDRYRSKSISETPIPTHPQDCSRCGGQEDEDSEESC